jgi:molybdate transport system substrate-binding protein
MGKRACGWLATAALLLASALSGCTTAGAGGSRSTEVRVFAAVSLTAALQAAKPLYEAKHKGTTVVLNLGASNGLRAQIEQGADADLFISASKKEVEPLAAKGETKLVQPFAHNHLVVVVSPEGAARVRSLTDLTGSGVRLVLADPATPIGDYTDQALVRMQKAGSFGVGFRDQVLANVRSFQHSEQEVMSKVLLGEADAGIVYRSSVSAAAKAKGVQVVEISEALAPPVDFYVAVMKDAGAPSMAFVDWLTSTEGRQLLNDFGFLPATPAGT